MDRTISYSLLWWKWYNQSMQIGPRKGRVATVLIICFIFTALYSIYFRIEDGAVSVITMAGEKAIASYQEEVSMKENLKLSASTTSTSTASTTLVTDN